jgi:hypothetical protein
MRQLAFALIVLAALLFLAGAHASLFTTPVFGRGEITLGRGAIAFLAFAIAVLQLHAAPKA